MLQINEKCWQQDSYLRKTTQNMKYPVKRYNSRGFLFTTSYHNRLSNATKYIASGDYTLLFSLMIYDAA